MDSKKPNSNMVSLMHPFTDIVWEGLSWGILVGKVIDIVKTLDKGRCYDWLKGTYVLESTDTARGTSMKIDRMKKKKKEDLCFLVILKDF